MPDDSNTQAAGNAGTDGQSSTTGTDQAKTGTTTDTASTNVDFSKLSDEQLSKVLEDPRTFNLPRIKELREQAKKAKDYEAEQAKANEEKLIKEKKFDEVLQQHKARIQELEGKLQSGQLDNTLRGELQKAGVKNIEAGLRLLDRTNLKIGEDGKIEGLDTALQSFKQQFPELLTSSNASVGSGTNPANPGTGAPVTMANLRDPVWYNDPANAATIKAIRAGTQSVKED